MNHFTRKKITLVGLGLLGRGLGDAKYLAEHGARLIITDLKSEEELQASLDQLKKFPNITYRLGEHDLEDFENRDYILKAAGVPLDSKYINHARSKNIPIKMDESWFAELMPEGVTIIGVTGTRGKTTTTYLIYELLKAAKIPVHLGGNIRGMATLPLLDTVKSGDYVVMELSSWQLQGFGDAGMSPHIAVFTNFLDDHLNYYHDNRFLYFKDKAQIFTHQGADDYLITGPRVPQHISECDFSVHSEHIETSSANIPNNWKLGVPGRHHAENSACALAVGKILGIDLDTCKNVLEGFAGVEGRLQFLREYRGIKIYNDNNATTEDATIAALQALKNNGPVTLIMGGADKKLSVSKLLDIIPDSVEHLIVLPGSGTERIRNILVTIKPDVVFVDSMQKAVESAVKCTSEGVILMSPAFASFGLFANEYDRNDQFVTAVNALQENTEIT